MKKRNLHRLMLCALACLTFFTACTKNESPEISQKAALQKANKWLNDKISVHNAERNARVEEIRKNLDVSKATTEITQEGDKLIIIPLAKPFKLNYRNTDPADHYLLLFDNPKKGLYKGNIVQYRPLNENDHTLPANTLSKLWDCDSVKANGTFSFLTIFDRLLYEADYKEGMRTRYATVSEGKKRNPSAELWSCIDWYLITTIYYDDGTTETIESYLGQTCFNKCVPGELCSIKEDDGLPGGGGGDAPPDDEIIVTTPIVWTVYTHPNDNTWKVVSRDIFTGKKGSAIPGGGVFTRVTNQYITSPLPSQSIYYWKATNVQGEVYEDGKKARSTIAGNVTGVGFPKTLVIETKSYTFSQLFP